VAALAGTIERGMEAPPEVLSYFRAKDLRPGFSWADVWGEEHAHAFTVAGVTETRVLSEFQAAIDKAIAAGTGFEKFRADMRERLTPLGWWGPKDVTDPEGRWRDKRVDFSRPARLQITFWSNMRAARAAGQWNRIQRTKRALPYLLYVRSASERKRPEHLRFVGTILPVDHPFWSTHFPPNGWNCKCSVRQLDQADRDDLLSRPKSDGEGAISYDDTPPDLGRRAYVNRRTGEVTEVPVGIDPGWATNSGLSRARTLTGQLQEQLAAVGPERAQATIRKLWDTGRAEWPRALAKMAEAETVDVPVAASARAAERVGADSALVTVGSDVLAAATRPGAAVGLDRYGLVQRILDTGEWLPDGTVRATIGGEVLTATLRRTAQGRIAVGELRAAPQPKPAPKPKPKPEPKPEIVDLPPLQGYAQEWRDAFVARDPDIVRVLSRAPPVKRVDRWDDRSTGDAFYDPTWREIHMGRRVPSTEGGQVVWRHEFGHHIDHTHRGRGIGSWVSPTAAPVMEATAGELVAAAGKAKDVEEALKRATIWKRAAPVTQRRAVAKALRDSGAGITYDDLAALPSHPYVRAEVQIVRLAAAVVARDAEALLDAWPNVPSRRMLSDLLHAVTDGRIGDPLRGAHSRDYYDRYRHAENSVYREGHTIETFADWFSFRAGPPAERKIVEHVMPALSVHFEALLRSY
jgi:hypothetical protein